MSRSTSSFKTIIFGGGKLLLSISRDKLCQRTHKRKKVKDQTFLYAAFAKLHFPTIDVKGVAFIGPENKVLCKTNSGGKGVRKYIQAFLTKKHRNRAPYEAVF